MCVTSNTLHSSIENLSSSDGHTHSANGKCLPPSGRKERRYGRVKGQVTCCRGVAKVTTCASTSQVRTVRLISMSVTMASSKKNKTYSDRPRVVYKGTACWSTCTVSSNRVPERCRAVSRYWRWIDVRMVKSSWNRALTAEPGRNISHLRWIRVAWDRLNSRATVLKTICR